MLGEAKLKGALIYNDLESMMNPDEIISRLRAILQETSTAHLQKMQCFWKTLCMLNPILILNHKINMETCPLPISRTCQAQCARAKNALNVSDQIPGLPVIQDVEMQIFTKGGVFSIVSPIIVMLYMAYEQLLSYGNFLRMLSIDTLECSAVYKKIITKCVHPVANVSPKEFCSMYAKLMPFIDCSITTILPKFRKGSDKDFFRVLHVDNPGA